MTDNREGLIVGWTGHRPDVFADPAEARRAVYAAADAVLGRSGPCTFVCGGQRGVDQWATSAARRRGIPFRLVLPNPPRVFTAGWSRSDRMALARLIGGAASVETADEAGRLGPLAYDLRNERVVRHADLLIAIWGGVRRGGTFHTLCAARERGIPVEEVRVAVRLDFDFGSRGV